MRVTGDNNLLKAAIALKRNCRLKENCETSKCIFFKKDEYNRCCLDDVTPEYWRVGENDTPPPIRRDNDRKAQPPTFFIKLYYIEFKREDGNRYYYCGEVQTDENGLKEAVLESGNPNTYGRPELYSTEEAAIEKAESLVRTCKNVTETYSIRDVIKEMRLAREEQE